MTLTLNKTLVVSLAAALLACAGPAGPEGQQGQPGPAGAAGAPGATGPGFQAGPSLSAVVPHFALTGAAHEIQISGFATEWKSATPPTVTFGEGVTVSGVTVASPTALLVEIDVAATAAAGTRTVTVTDAGKSATYQSAFELVPPLSVEGTAQVSQLALTVVTVTNNDPGFTLSTTGSDYKVTAGAGLVADLWKVERDAFQVVVLANLDATLGTQDVVVEATSTEGTTRTVTFGVNVGAAQIEDANTTQTAGSLTAPNTSKAYRFTMPMAGSYTVKSTWNDMTVMKDPNFVVTTSSGSFGDIIARNSNPKFGGAAGTVFYVVVYTSETTGGFMLDFTYDPTIPAVEVVDTEPNSTAATAQSVALPFETTAGNLEFTVDEHDFYKFTLAAGDVGKTVVITHLGGGADLQAEVLAADGTTSLGVSGNLYFGNAFTSPALTTAGDYYIRMGVFGTTYDGTYTISAEIK